MIKPFLEIKFDNNNSDLRLLISRRSFADTSEKIAKELLKKIAKISEKEYGISFKDCYSKLLKITNNDMIFIENGILLINQTYEKITNNFLMLLRLSKPVYLKKDFNIKTDVIFTILTPNNINTSNFTYLEPNNPDILFVLLETIGNSIIKINANNIKIIKEIEGNYDYPINMTLNNKIINIKNLLDDLLELEGEVNDFYNNYIESISNQTSNQFYAKIFRITILKLILVDYFRMSDFQLLFGKKYYELYPTNINDGDLPKKTSFCNSGNDEFISNWSSISILDIITNSATRSNIIDLSCLYNTTKIIESTLLVNIKKNTTTQSYIKVPLESEIKYEDPYKKTAINENIFK